jgi:hypothetical protein
VNLTNTINQITTEALNYAPLLLNAVTSIESAAAHLPGETKAQLAVNIVMAAAQTATAVPIPSVQAVAGLVSLVVGLLNASGLFKHKPASLPPALGSLAAVQSTGLLAQGSGQSSATSSGIMPPPLAR